MGLTFQTFLDALLGDAEIENVLSAANTVGHVLAFEIALAQACAEGGLIDAAAAEAISRVLSEHRPDDAALRAGAAKDGVFVPALVRELCAELGAQGASLHPGATSQDATDTAQALALQQANTILSDRLKGLIERLGSFAKSEAPLMGRTRMRRALPITVGHRVRAWRDPLARHVERLDALSARLHVLHLGGPVGNREGIDDTLFERVASILDLRPLPVEHSQRDTLVEYAGWLSLVTGSLGKMGRDVTLMGQDELDEIELVGAGGSSAMAHKRNPVAAEVLISLAAHNAALLSGMHGALVHEQERSGAAWTLEWLTLPRMVVTTGCALLRAAELVTSIERIGPLKAP